MTSAGQRVGRWVLVVLLPISLGSGFVAAGTYYAKWASRTFSGITYQYTASGDNNGSGHGAARIVAESSRPAGYLGAEGNLYAENGAECIPGSMAYSSSSGRSYSNRRTNQCDYNAYYYSQGKVAVWRGSSYTYVNTARTVYFRIDP